MQIHLEHSKTLSDYRKILEGLVEDFGYTYYHAILVWCNVIGDHDQERYWQVWLIKKRKTVVGMCGLYSLEKNSTENLWLGWFGILPKYRSTGIGGIALEKMTEVARVLGCKALHSYVDESGKPLKFYYRHGFEKLCSVREFLEKTKADPSDFEGMDDHVIRKILV